MEWSLFLKKGEMAILRGWFGLSKRKEHVVNTEGLAFHKIFKNDTNTIV